MNDVRMYLYNDWGSHEVNLLKLGWFKDCDIFIISLTILGFEIGIVSEEEE